MRPGKTNLGVEHCKGMVDEWGGVVVSIHMK